MKAVASVVLEPQDIQQALQDHIAKVLNVTAEIGVIQDQATGQYGISVLSAEFNRTPNVSAKSAAATGKKRGRRTKAEIEAAKANGETAEAAEATEPTGLLDTLYADAPTTDEAVAQGDAEMAAEQVAAEVPAEPVAEPAAVTEFQ